MLSGRNYTVQERQLGRAGAEGVGKALHASRTASPEVQGEGPLRHRRAVDLV